MNDLSAVSTIFNSAIGNGFIYLVTILIWCIVLIIIGFKHPAINGKSMRWGISLLVLSLLLPAIGQGIFDVFMNSIQSNRYGGMNNDALLPYVTVLSVIGLIAKICAVVSVSFAFHAIINADVRKP